MNNISEIINETSDDIKPKKELKEPKNFQETHSLQIKDIKDLRYKIIYTDLEHEFTNTQILNNVYSKLLMIFFDKKMFWIWLCVMFILYVVAYTHVSCDCNTYNIIQSFCKSVFIFILYIIIAILAIFPTIRTLRKFFNSLLEKMGK